MSTENIDDMLMQSDSERLSRDPKPMAEPDPQETEDKVTEPEQKKEQKTEEQTEHQEETSSNADKDGKDDNNADDSSEYDDYGNKKAKEKLYTKEEVDRITNEKIRERLARGNHNQKEEEAVTQHAKENFKFDENSNEDLQKQLQNFIEQTVTSMSTRQYQQQQQKEQERLNYEFQQKVLQGNERFENFTQIVSAQPFTDAMTEAVKGLDDPAAFLHAASTKAKDDLKRISKIQNPYTQMIEMGKLDDKLRQSKRTTKAPKPVERTKGDGGNLSIDEPTSMDDLLRASDNKRLESLKRRRGY